MAQDILLKYSTANGTFDIVLGEQDIESVDGMETTIAVLLFTDARAAPSEVTEPSKRRGWVGNILRSTELGGMVWLSDQLRNEQLDRNKLEQWALNCLQPLLDLGMATEVNVSVPKEGARGAGLHVEITINEGNVQKYDYWEQTDLRNLTNGD